jgi:hypothetical protein
MAGISLPRKAWCLLGNDCRDFGLMSGTVGWERGFHQLSIEKADVFARG